MRDNSFALEKSMKLEQLEPTVIQIDNKSAKLLTESLKSTHNTKHINLRINFIRMQVSSRVIQLKFVRTEVQVSLINSRRTI